MKLVLDGIDPKEFICFRCGRPILKIGSLVTVSATIKIPEVSNSITVTTKGYVISACHNTPAECEESANEKTQRIMEDKT